MGRDGLQADRHFIPPAACRLTQEEQVHEECSRPAIVPHEVGHQNIEDVCIERESFHSGKYYSSYRYEAPRGIGIILPRCPLGELAMITQLKFVGIPTADQDRALRFYTEKLGFAVSTEQPFNEKQRWIELRICNSPTRVVLFTPDGQEDRIGTFFNGAFSCDDVQATYRQLKERGVEFLKEPQKQPWGEFAIFKDPDGNQFVLSST